LLAASLCTFAGAKLGRKETAGADRSGERSHACWVMLEGRCYGGE
jgi:hypothetical protein